MRNIIKILTIIILTSLGISCADESLNPLQFDKVKKGTVLALRGDQLASVYFDEEPYGQAFYANNILGDETFNYEAEFLSGDPTSLSSMDIFVIKRTKSGDGTVQKERILLTNIPFSSFQNTEAYPNPWIAVSLPLADILSKIGADLSTEDNVAAFMDLYKDGVQMETDLNLADGSILPSENLVAAGLYESDQFYPAQRLIFGVENIDDARPVATTSLRGQYAVSGGKVVRTIIPLKAGAKDTLNIVFDQVIDGNPTVTISPAAAGTVGELVKKEGTNEYYVPFIAGATYTGNVTFTISGATSGEAGAQAGLEQNTKTATIAVDNLAPQNTSFTTGTRLGKGQSATIKLTFNEALASAPTISFDVTNTGIDPVSNVKTTLSADGMTATYLYEYKDSDANATHGDIIVSITGGKDKAGNELPAIASKTLTIDIGTAPAPIITLDPVMYDWGTLIRWTLSYVTGPANVGGSTTGTVYYVAQTAGSAAPTGFVGGDVPGFKMATGVSAKQVGTVAVSVGTSGSVFSPFTPNGNLDIYVVFVSSSGVIGQISMPTTVSMN